ncbi:GNAT family N-acetyltransferase [Geomesophilobacter sediminis]|uniref:GNAT family N-acetyltransferase n=1 Tax=Geomesophilobacter sediminis TaxID=2798584 RepID=A0A8J7M2H6_9BACT|nr:GNAT family N-acetyltransferase [Geomesophilobacter sediminis]MBJ6727314.1 GNAT family N-acetyltransferase [Geomesophilobacter sediminis]
MVARSAPPPVHFGDLCITRVGNRSELDRQGNAWRALAAGNPMLSPEWLLSWWDGYATSDDELWVLLVHDPHGALVGLAPLYRHVAGGRATLALLGSGDAATAHSTWLAPPGRERLVGAAVAQALSEWASFWDAIELDWIDSDDGAVHATLEALSQRDLLVHRAPYHHSCWQIALPSTWEGFLAMISRSHRKRCRKWERLYLDSGRVRLRQVDDAAGLEEGFEVLFRLHGARWGDRRHPLGCFSDERFRNFHRTVAGKLLERGQLFLFWLELDGAPIAVEYQFVDRGTLYSYLAGMDPEVTEFPPGNLSIMVAIRHAIAHGLTSFDLSRGNQPYKANWRATPVPCEEVRIWPNRFTARIEAARWQSRKGVERTRLQAVHWIKSHLSDDFVDRWRQATYLLTGNRFGPRKGRT